MGFFGVLLHHWARRELRKGSEPPAFREYLRVARAWEIGLEAASIVFLVAGFVVPWVVTGSAAAGVFVFLGVCVLMLLVAVPVLAVNASRGLPPPGTYWDGTVWRRR